MMSYKELFEGDGEAEVEVCFFNIKKNGRDFWFIEENEKKPSFLATYPKVTLKSKFFSAFIEIVWFLNIQSFFFKKRIFKINSASIYSKIKSCCVNVSFFVGTPGVNRKIVVVGSESVKGSRLFFKVPTSLESSLLVSNELESVAKMGFLNVKPHIIPRIRDCNDIKAFTEVSCEGFFENRSYLNNISDFYGKIYLQTCRDDFLSNFLIKQIKNDFFDCDSKSPIDNGEFFRLLKNISNLCNKLLSSNNLDSDTTINVYFSHGDFTRWNVFPNKNGSLSVIDWEMAGYRPKYFDIIHFFYTDFVFLRRKNSNDSLSVYDSIILNVRSIIEVDDIELYISLYVILQVEYYIPKYIMQKEELHEQVYWQMESWVEMLERCVEG